RSRLHAHGCDADRDVLPGRGNRHAARLRADQPRPWRSDLHVDPRHVRAARADAGEPCEADLGNLADLPARIAPLARQQERVALMLLDASGMRFVERHAKHPLLQRLEIEPVASQFPSTTTAHLTTLYTGLPVEQHGLYEWKYYEPLVDDVVIPLPFVRW